MAAPGINEADLDSPGYEFLRSHRSMINLYYKLMALDYQRDFCPAYKCPPINQYYFSSAQQNNFEQQFVFACLCAWLIRDKCQMNFQLDLDDISACLREIFEALSLLHDGDDQQLDSKVLVRLEQGYGPEVVYALSCFADRALEVALELDPTLGSSHRIYFHNKLHDRQARPANSITIGQPIVGGTLTTRSLGKYSIEDSSLVLDYQGDETNGRQSGPGDEGSSATTVELDAAEWEQQVARVAPQLRAAIEEPSGERQLQEHLGSVAASKRALEGFLGQSRSVLRAVEARAKRQLQVVSSREKFLQTNLSDRLEGFLSVWRERCAEQESNEKLTELVNARTDSFEAYGARLKMLVGDIETRIGELNDGSRLRELERLTGQLEAQADELDVKVGLLLAVYGKR